MPYLVSLTCGLLHCGKGGGFIPIIPGNVGGGTKLPGIAAPDPQGGPGTFSELFCFFLGNVEDGPFSTVLGLLERNSIPLSV